jgi:hypothetical protein
MRFPFLTRSLRFAPQAAKAERNRQRPFSKRIVVRHLFAERLEDRTLLDGGAAGTSQLLQAYGQIPLSFEANQGQTDACVNFLSHGSGYGLFLTPTEAILSLSKPAAQGAGPTAGTPTEDVLHMQLVGGNAAPRVVGLDPQATTSNYFIGNDPSRWHTGLANYAKVEYQDVYPGIDLVYYGNQRQLEYDFIVAPGADPGAIGLEFRGTDSLTLDGAGNLVLHTAGGDVVEHAPVIYHEISGSRQPVSGRYVREGQDRVSFQVVAYDTSRPLVIDPVLSYATYLGGSGSDTAGGIAVDASGNAYITGQTTSSNFPTTPGALQTTLGASYSVFVSKVNATGNALLYSTYLGGGNRDEGTGIALDASGNAYVTGYTSSTNFPTTPGVVQTTNAGGSWDAFVAKITISQATATAVGPSENPSVYGKIVTFTATVTSGGSPVTSGTVTFQEGSTILASGVSLNASGQANFSISSLIVGTHTITAYYSGAGSFPASSGSVAQMVNPAPLAVTANAASKLYGQANPAFAASYSGFVNSDTASSLSGTLALSTPATMGSPVGNYAITPSGLTSSNYAITFMAGTLTITPAPLTITAESKTKVYGAALPTLTASYSGFVNGDTPASLTTPVTLTTTATTASHVAGSPYSISASGAQDSNYTISYVAGNLTVTSAPLTITVDAKTKLYGAPIPTLTVSYTGLVNGDTPATFGTTPNTAPTVTTAATANSHVAGSPNSIAASGAAETDYSIGYVAGSLTVTPVPLTITANNTTRVYGAANPGVTVSYSGFVLSDGPSALGGALAFATLATPTSPVGNNYSVTPSGLTATDYAISFVNGTLTVSQRTVSVAVSLSAATINEGQIATVTVTVSDTSGPALVNVDPSGTVSLSASGPLMPSATSGTLVGNGSGVSTSQVTVTGVDNPGGAITANFAGDAIHGSGSNSAGLTVNNVAPTPGAITAPLSPQSLTTTINTSAGFTDPGVRDTHTAVWSWGDSTTSAGSVTESNGSGSVAGSHTYSTEGVFTITLTVTDKDGGVGTSIFQYVVVYDPSAGFVTGGGWITSPTGAYVPNPALTGKAHFGFNSEYKPGRSVPSGDTEFQFDVGNLDFHSTAYDWLTIINNMAQYQGNGTINGAGNYKVVLTSVDGDLLGGTGPDTFRIRIWDPTVNPSGNGSNYIYENYPSGNLYNDPSGTPLGGGEVVIHKSNQRAAGGPGHNPGIGPLLTAEELQPIVTQAIVRWEEAGAAPSQVSHLEQINIRIGSLPPGILAMTGPGIIWISPDAAGYGWFIDPIPGNDAAFLAMPGSPAQERMDLLTVMAHELGHIILGMDESPALNDVMTEALKLASHYPRFKLGTQRYSQPAPRRLGLRSFLYAIARGDVSG